MRHWKFYCIVFVSIVSLFVAGCSPDEAVEENQDENQVEEEAEGAFPATIVDAVGDEVVIEEEPETIVSLIPSNTEIVYALGQGDKVIGRSEFDNYPAEVQEIESIGGLELDLEKIIELDPDLVLAYDAALEGLDQLRQADLTVVVVNSSNSFSEAYESIEVIGQATGAVDEAAELIDEIQTGLSAVEEELADLEEEEKRTVWLEISDDLFTAGQQTFMNDFIELINAENIAEIEGWAQLTEEEVISLQPDVIILTYSYIENAVDEVKARSAWSDVPAVEHDRVFQVDEDLMSRPGPRLIEGAEELARHVYPEVFEN